MTASPVPTVRQQSPDQQQRSPMPATYPPTADVCADVPEPRPSESQRGPEIGQDGHERDHDARESPDDPWNKMYIPERHFYSQPTARDRAYTFLLRTPVVLLRKLAKEKKSRQTGVKNTVICNMMLLAASAVIEGSANWDTVFGKPQTDFWTTPGNQVEQARVAPSHELILEHVQGHRNNGGSDAGSGTTCSARNPPMASFEFARLMAILTEREDARLALIRSGRELSREQQQRREGRDEFWDDLIAKLFNDSSVRVSFDFSGCLDDDDEISALDANGAPPCTRTGAWLKDKFFAVRSLFTRAFNNWTVSGQNDAEGNDFHNFVAPAPGARTMSSQGRCYCIMFYAMKCGTPDEDTEVLNFACKLSPERAGYDDGEDRHSNSARGGSARKKRKAIDELQEATKQRGKDLQHLTRSVCSFLETFTEKHSSEAKNSTADGDDLIVVLTERIHKLTKDRAELIALGIDDPVSNFSISVIDKELRKVHEQYERLMQ